MARHTIYRLQLDCNWICQKLIFMSLLKESRSRTLLCLRMSILMLRELSRELVSSVQTILKSWEKLQGPMFLPEHFFREKKKG